jgi:D-alanyl-D-alanine carboxypeptidase
MNLDELATSVGIETQVQRLLEAAGAPGAAIALILDGQPWSPGIGHATREGEERLEPSAHFSIYSVTKTAIASIVMKLAESGALLLDDPIGAHVPGLPFHAPVWARQALNHTGGFPDYGDLTDYHNAVSNHPHTSWTPGEFLERTAGGGLLFAPGQGWRYSNIGYMLLRLMIERLAGLSFREAVRRFLSKPLGLQAFTVVDSLGDASALTPGYSVLLDPEDAPTNSIPRYHPGWVSHGLVASTAADLARFVELLFLGRVVGPGSLSAMLEAEPVGERHPWMTAPSYGLGLMIDPANRFGCVAGHTGGGPGYSTAAYHFPDVAAHRVTSVALVNRDGNDIATDIVFSIAGWLAGALTRT